VSDDGEHFDKVASGDWELNNQMKIASFDPVEASYIRLEAVKGHEGFASASEILLEEHAVIEAGDQIPLDLQVKKQNGQLENIDNVDVIYSSDNTDVVEVDENGLMTAKKAGQAT